MARFGDLDTQYLDDAGNPLVNGKVYFYESGTTTLKNTFADVNLSIPNTNPVILTAAGRQPNIFFDGVAKAILTSNSDVQILVRDPIGETATDFGDEWVATKIYGANDVVLGSDGVYYRSLVSGNQNNNPVSTTNFWTLLYSVDWNAGITYQVGAVVTYNGEQYQSLQGSNLNQNPSTASSYWVLLSFAWLATATYSDGQNAVGTDGILYTSLQDSNTGNDPATSPAYWVGTSAAAAASAVAAAASATAAAASETAAETAETNAETAQAAAEAAQTAAETAETNAETAETGAEAAQAAAEAAQSAAETAQANAETAETNAETAETNAETAQAAAEAAQSAAETAETNAETAETNAETAQAAAEAAQAAAETAETNAETAETNAETAQTAAEAAQAAAETAETNAETAESNAATSASNAATSATAAAGSATAAAGSATDAADKYDEFDDRYLGDKASDPTLDNDGNALLTGALYFNTTSDVMRVYNGSAWQDTAISPNSPTFTGTVTADGLSLGDNDKATFGNSNDLEIYHDGSQSIIADVGAGPLRIKGGLSGAIYLENSTGETMLYAIGNGEVSLYHDNALKLATTSTGIDVTGTVVSDAIQVDTDSGITLKDGGDSRTLTFKIDAGTGRYQASGSADHFFTTTDSNLARFYIANNGDISFYEDTGTTPKFFWDASAESLGIGGASPAGTAFTVTNAGAEGLEIRPTGGLSGGTSITAYNRSGSAYIPQTYNASEHIFVNSGSAYEKMRIDSSGNVGIGTSSPNSVSKLQVEDITSSAYISVVSSNTGNAGITFGDSDSDLVGGVLFNNADNALRFFKSGFTEGMRLDSSGNVGIGNTVASTINTANGVGNLVVGSGSGSEGITIYTGTTGIGGLAFADGTTTTDTYRGYLKYAHSADEMSLWTAATQRLTIDSSGKVSIGTDTGTSFSSALLHVSDATNNSQSFVITGADVTSEYLSLGVSGTGETQITAGGAGTTSNALTFHTASSGTEAERMRIDASGNLLVGTTTTSISSSTGTVLDNRGIIFTSANDVYSIYANRTGSDGDIVTLRKVGTTVGSLGVHSTQLYIGKSDTGLYFNAGNDSIDPYNTSTPTPRSDAISLGAASRKFKDAHFSGTVNANAFVGDGSGLTGVGGGFEYVEYDVGGTSGFTLTGIPSGTKQIQIAFREVKIGAQYINFQIGDSGGVETSGYAWANKVFYTTITAYRNSTNDNWWEIFYPPAANGWSGNMTLSLVDSSTNTWVFTAQAASNYENMISNGRKTLSSELTQIKLLGGTFSSGSKVSVIYQ